MEAAYNTLVAEVIKDAEFRSKNLKQYLALLRTLIGYMDTGWANMPVKDMNQLLNTLLIIITKSGNKGEDRKIWRTVVHILDETLPAWVGVEGSAEHVVTTLLNEIDTGDPNKFSVILRVLGSWMDPKLERRHVKSGRGLEIKADVARVESVALPADVITQIQGSLFGFYGDAEFPVKAKAKMLSFGGRETKEFDARVTRLIGILSGLRRGGCRTKDTAQRILSAGGGFNVIQQCCVCENVTLARHAFAIVELISPFLPKEAAMVALTVIPRVCSLPASDMEGDVMCGVSAVRAAGLSLANAPSCSEFSSRFQCDVLENLLTVATQSTCPRISCEAILQICGDNGMTLASTKEKAEKDQPRRHMTVAHVWDLSDSLRTRGERDVGRRLSESLTARLRCFIGVFEEVGLSRQDRHSGMAATGGSTMDLSSGMFEVLLRTTSRLASFLAHSGQRAIVVTNASKSASFLNTSSSSIGGGDLLDLDFFDSAVAGASTTGSSSDPSTSAEGTPEASSGAMSAVTDVLLSLLQEMEEVSRALLEEGRRTSRDKPLMVQRRFAILMTLVWLLPESSVTWPATTPAAPTFFSFGGGSDAGGGLTTASVSNAGAGDTSPGAADTWALFSRHAQTLFSELAACDTPETAGPQSCPTLSLTIRADISSAQTAARALIRDFAQDLTLALIQRMGAAAQRTRGRPSVLLIEASLTLAERAVCLSPHHETTWLLTHLWGFLAESLPAISPSAVAGAVSATAEPPLVGAPALVLDSLLAAVAGSLVPEQEAMDFLDQYRFKKLYRGQADSEAAALAAAVEEEEEEEDSDLNTLDRSSQVGSQRTGSVMDTSVSGSLAASRRSLHQMRNSGARSVASRTSLSSVPGISSATVANSTILSELEKSQKHGSPDTREFPCHPSPVEPWTNSLEVLAQNALWLAVTHATRGAFGTSSLPWHTLSKLLSDERMTTPGLRACALSLAAETVHFVREVPVMPTATPATSAFPITLPHGGGMDISAQHIPLLQKVSALLADEMHTAMQDGHIGLVEVVSVSTALEARALDSHSSSMAYGGLDGLGNGRAAEGGSGGFSHAGQAQGQVSMHASQGAIRTSLPAPAAFQGGGATSSSSTTTLAMTEVLGLAGRARLHDTTVAPAADFLELPGFDTSFGRAGSTAGVISGGSLGASADIDSILGLF